jgi:hypothetical protein
MIFDNRICEAFDPIMILPEKSVNIVDTMKMSTSCLAPAFVYMEGSRGKRFLCDYHYYFEKSIVMTRTPELWPNISKYMVHILENVKNTFAESDGIQQIDNDKICWCTKQSYVKIMTKDGHIQYFCNFHYRKTYYRYITNKVVFEEIYTIRDERHRMNTSIIEEMEQLTVV